jgi:hypothetical protein
MPIWLFQPDKIMPLEKLQLQTPIAFPIVHKISESLPPDFSNLVFLRCQSNPQFQPLRQHTPEQISFKLSIESKSLNIREQFEWKINKFLNNNDCYITDTTYNWLNNFLNINPECLYACKDEQYISVQSNESFHFDFPNAMRHIYRSFCIWNNIDSEILKGVIGRQSIKMIINPNYIEVDALFGPEYADEINNFLKWLHGDNRTI